MRYCEDCLERQIKIEQLQEEVSQLKARLRQRERKAKEGFFGSSTPSAKIPIKDNTPEGQNKPRGGRPGHKGNGRQSIDEAEADRVEYIPSYAGVTCPQCGDLLEDKGYETRGVLDSRPVKAEKILYQLPKKYCRHCRKSFQPQAPGVLPRGLYGNQLIATASAMHYMHGIPMGRICEQMEIGAGALVEVFHTIGKLLRSVPQSLIEEYRQSPVKHADETGWRINGKNGYAWLFATVNISIFLFKQTRSSKVPKMVLCDEPLPGTLVVDRYAGYNKAPCALQYCYAHLLRDVEDLLKEFPDSEEIKTFVSVMAPLLTEAMQLRNQPITDEMFYAKAAKVKEQIIATVQSPALHMGIRRIQDIFAEKAHRMYHWAGDRRVPAENNLAERDLRPTVIARKVSFGSISDAGADTRGILMTVLNTLKKRKVNVVEHFKSVLDQLAIDMTLDPFKLLFPASPSPPPGK